MLNKFNNIFFFLSNIKFIMSINSYSFLESAFPNNKSKSSSKNKSNYSYLIDNKTSNINDLKNRIEVLESNFISFQDNYNYNISVLRKNFLSLKKKIKSVLKKNLYNVPSSKNFFNSSTQDPLTVIVLCISIVAILLCLTRK